MPPRTPTGIPTPPRVTQILTDLGFESPDLISKKRRQPSIEMRRRAHIRSLQMIKPPPSDPPEITAFLRHIEGQPYWCPPGGCSMCKDWIGQWRPEHAAQLTAFANSQKVNEVIDLTVDEVIDLTVD